MPFFIQIISESILVQRHTCYVTKDAKMLESTFGANIARKTKHEKEE
jgi:hypothetical protein